MTSVPAESFPGYEYSVTLCDFTLCYIYPIDMDQLKEELERSGYVKIPPTIFSLSSDQVSELQNEFDALFHGIYATGIYPDEIHWRPGISKESCTRELCNAWKASPIIASVVCSEVLGSLACALMGWTASRIGQDDVIYKPCLSNAVGFHQDSAYISDNFSPRENNSLTLWMALDDTDEENGALQYAPGSHLWSPSSPYDTTQDQKMVSSSSFHVGVHDDHYSSLRRAAELCGQCVEDVERSIQTVSVKAGEMIVHHQDVWHGSGPNLSQSRLRRALVAHLIDGDVQWRKGSMPHYIYGRYYIRGEATPREDFFPITSSTGTTASLVRTPWL